MKILYTILMFITALVASAQISVIHIDGDAFALSSNDAKKTYIKLAYGPVTHVEKIVVKPNSNVKLSKDRNLICNLIEGTYDLSDLKFVALKENSVFDKFCEYFHDFFTNHSSAESKENYRNNIYAISRGNTPPPSLDFPLKGLVPSDVPSLPFRWTHACDTCEYIFTISSLETRDIAYTIMTKDQSISIDHPSKYLKSGVNYFWSVKIVGMDMEYENIQFQISEIGDYQRNIEHTENTLKSINIPITDISKMLYVVSELDSNNKQNYALLYGMNMMNNDNKTNELNNLFERYWYDMLLDK